MDNATGRPASERKARPRNVRSHAAEAAFRARLAELGATLLEPEWLGSKAKHRAICAAGHECTPTPHYVRAGDGICLRCARRDPADAEAAFRARLVELGAELLEPKWLGALAKHRIRCAAGHECFQRPNRIQQGVGVCWVCSGRHPGVAEQEFRNRVEALGGSVHFEQWRGVNHPHHVRCREGHDCYPCPAGVQQGRGICRTCAVRDPVAAEKTFRALVEERGGVPLWTRWRGIKAPHHLRCPKGHDCYPRPNDVQQGSGLCRTCAGRDPATAEAAFRARLAELGATPLFREWRGAQVPHRIKCAAGHVCYPRPGCVVYNGQGACKKCAGKSHTVMYVLGHEIEPVVKFGITCRDGQKRLADHRKDGFTTVHLLVANLPDGVADAAEKAVIAALTLARAVPSRGREYFDESYLPLILDVAESWLA